MGLSGTSGGAICALLAWYGLLIQDRQKGMQLLDAFWSENAAATPVESIVNDWLVWINRMRATFPIIELNPYWLPPIGQEKLAGILKKLVPFERLPDLIRKESPVLFIGAVNVLTGEFTVFRDRHPEEDKRISVEALLASACIPTMFPAVRMSKHNIYWDGLFSQNPPVRDFVDGLENPDHKPDEIWVIQINPESTVREPKSLRDIEDRRNELSGNLSLNQELEFIKTINKWIESKRISHYKFKNITLRTIPLDLDLDYSSKLDRSPDFIQGLIAEGQKVASKFLKELREQH